MATGDLRTAQLESALTASIGKPCLMCGVAGHHGLVFEPSAAALTEFGIRPKAGKNKVAVCSLCTRCKKKATRSRAFADQLDKTMLAILASRQGPAHNFRRSVIESLVEDAMGKPCVRCKAPGQHVASCHLNRDAAQNAFHIDHPDGVSVVDPLCDPCWMNSLGDVEFHRKTIAIAVAAIRAKLFNVRWYRTLPRKSGRSQP
jgi:hypothetical protein